MSRHTPLEVAFRRPWPGTVRGRSLWFMSIIIGLKGLGYLLGNAPAATDRALQLATKYVPLQWCGAVFVVVCAFAWFCSYCHLGRDRYGYMALGGLTLGWAGIYLIPLTVSLAFSAARWLGVDAPHLEVNAYSAAQGALSYLLIFAFVRFLSRNVTLKDILHRLDGDTA